MKIMNLKNKINCAPHNDLTNGGGGGGMGIPDCIDVIPGGNPGGKGGGGGIDGIPAPITPPAPPRPIPLAEADVANNVLGVFCIPVPPKPVLVDKNSR